MLWFECYSTTFQQKGSNFLGYLEKKWFDQSYPSTVWLKVAKYSIDRVSNAFRVGVLHEDFNPLMHNVLTWSDTL